MNFAKQKFILILVVIVNFTSLLAVSVSFGDIEETTHKNAQKYCDFLIGEYELAQGDLTDSAEAFNRLGDSEGATHGLIRVLSDQNRHDLIIKHVGKFKDDIEIQLIFFRSFLALEKVKQAEKVLLELTKRNPKDASVSYYYSVFLIGEKRFEQAVKFMDEFIKKTSCDSRHFLFYFLKAKTYLSMEQVENAKNSLKECLKLNSNFDKALLLKANIAEKEGDTKEAMRCYKNILDMGVQNEFAQQQLVNYLFEKKEYKEAEKILRMIPGNNAEYFFDLALVEWKSGQHESALKDINASLRMQPNSDSACSLKVEILFSMKKGVELVTFLKGWLLKDPKNKKALDFFVLLKGRGLSKDLVIKVLSSLTKTKEAKNSKSIWALLGDLYLENKNFNESLNCYKKVLSLGRDELLKSKLFYQIAYVYISINDGSKVEESLKNAMDCKEIYLPVYNLLANYYLQTNNKIDDALTLIDKALKHDPSNSAYLDTKACLLIKKGKKAKARKIFRKALELDPGSIILKDHYKLCE